MIEHILAYNSNSSSATEVVKLQHGCIDLAGLLVALDARRRHEALPLARLARARARDEEGLTSHRRPRGARLRRRVRRVRLVLVRLGERGIAR